MATSFSAAALGAEGLAADVQMLVGNGYIPGPRGVRSGAAARRRRRPRTLRAEVVMATTSRLGLDKTDVRRARTLARQVGRPIVKLAQQHTTVSVERATLRLAGLAGADPDGTPWVNRLLDVVRADVGLEHGVALPVWHALRRGARRRPADPGPEGQRGQRHLRAPRRQGRHRRRPRRQEGRGRRHQAHRRQPSRPRADDQEDRRRPAQAVDLPDRRHRRHLRGHPAGAGGRPRGRRHHRGDPLDRAEPARLRARGRDPRGLRRHLRHPGELPPDARRPRRDVARARAATSGSPTTRPGSACPRSPPWPGSSGST